MEEIEVGEKVYYKKDMEDKWRGPAKVIGKEGKTVIVKQGSDVRGINRSHVIKVRKSGDYFKKTEEEGDDEDGEEEESDEEITRVMERGEINEEEESGEEDRVVDRAGKGICYVC